MASRVDHDIVVGQHGWIARRSPPSEIRLGGIERERLVTRLLRYQRFGRRPMAFGLKADRDVRLSSEEIRLHPRQHELGP